MDLNIRAAGAAGQGMQTTAEVLGKAAMRYGLSAHCYLDAESRIRGGLNFSHLRLSDSPVGGTVNRVDILIAQTDQAAAELAPSLAKDGLLIAEKATDHPQAAPFVLSDLAKEAGAAKASGIAAVGALADLIGLDQGLIDEMIREMFQGKDKLIEVNLKAAALGRQAAREMDLGDRFRMSPPAGQGDRLWLNGAEAIALGATAGGVSFLAGYPMSPATGIMANLAAWGDRTGVHVEQAEDEVAAINMVAGAAYSGARSMTATSGGGYCLMTEGASLIGMMELPAVLALAQRPGPATGLPTREAQGDLNLVRHGGHGFFPKIILAPKNIADCVEVTARAFDLAERFQTIVYVLTDQHLQDSRVTCPPPDLADLPNQRHVLTADELDRITDYKRYAWSDDGVSPLALPGKSAHLVYADSDEHDEIGHITESGEVAEMMFNKREAKQKSIARAAWPGELDGDPATQPLIVTWGSTYETVREALGLIREQGVEAAHLHLRWLWPLGETDLDRLAKAKRLIVAECSAGGELASIIQEVAARPVDGLVTKNDGRPFMVEQLAEVLTGEVNR